MYQWFNLGPGALIYFWYLKGGGLFKLGGLFLFWEHQSVQNEAFIDVFFKSVKKTWKWACCSAVDPSLLEGLAEQWLQNFEGRLSVWRHCDLYGHNCGDWDKPLFL